MMGLRRLRVLVALAVAGGGVLGCSFQEPLPDPSPEGEPGLSVERPWSGQLVGSLGAGAFALEPGYADGNLYVADNEGLVRAVDAETREPLWRQRLDTSLSAGPVPAGERLLVGDRQGRVHALDRATGEPEWVAELSAQVLARPRESRGVVVARTTDGRVYGLDAADGEELWLLDRSVPALTLRRNSAPALSGSTAIVGLQSGQLVALDTEDGSIRWEHTLAERSGRTELERMADIAADPVIGRGAAYAVAYQGAVAAVRVATGTEAWRREVGSHRGLALGGETLYVAADDGRVWALDRRNGATAWRQDALEGLTLTRPAIRGEYLVVGDDAGHVSWLRRRDGALVARTEVSGEPIQRPPVVTEAGGVYVIDAEGQVKALRPR